MKNIHSNKQQDIWFNFNEVPVSKVRSLIQEINHGKACGFDQPLSVLTCLSNFFEKIYNEQLNDHFKNVLSVLLSAFRKHYGCEHVLTKLIEDCKHALDENQNVGLILLDLSKAFDCLPHWLLLCKLRAYGVSYESCKLIKSYLCNRLQRVKVASTRSEWAVMPKGVPQGSVLGPLLLNIFLNDIFYSFKHNQLLLARYECP